MSMRSRVSRRGVLVAHPGDDLHGLLRGARATHHQPCTSPLGLRERLIDDGVVGALSAMRDRDDLRATLTDIAVPTLVIAGSDDQLIPLPATKAMADAIPGAHFSVIPAAGHMSPAEQPVNTSRVIKEFLEALS